jgi:diguanylate cyclase (GGDEF)-like protein
MTNGGSRMTAPKPRWNLSALSTPVVVGILVLIVGLFVGSTVVRAVCILLFMGSVVYAFISARNSRVETKDQIPEPSEDDMKKLLFDDFQASGGKYVVRQVEDEGKVVVPSTKSARPASISVKPETVRELEIPDFFDLDSEAAYADTEPKSEFHSLLNKVLLMVKDVLFAHSVAFFWANREKKQMVLEAMATDSKGFMTEKRFNMEQDLLSQVAMTGKPQVLGRMDPASGKDLLRYYENPDDVKSVLCVPVFFMSGSRDILPVGVVIADSLVEDAFGAETLALMGRVTKLISGLVKSYTDKYDLLLDSELLSSIRRLQDRIKGEASEQTVLAALVEETNRLANYDFLTVTMYDDDKHAWVLQKVVNKSGEQYLAPEAVIDIEGSVVGNSIRNNAVASVEDLTQDPMPRFCADESMEHTGSFLTIPISSFNRCYGAFSIESRRVKNFSGSESETIYRLVENAATALEVLYLNDLIREHVVVDQLTGSLTRKHFLKKLEEEVRRAEDFNAELAFVSFAVDGMTGHRERYGTEGVDTIVNEVARIIRSNIRVYDVLGRQGDDTLGVLLINMPASDGYLWAEKIRKMIASHVLMIGPSTLSVTVSAGVCGLTTGMHVDELVAGTTQVLGKAIEHGGNLVRIF